MLPIGTADSKTLHLPSHLPARKGDNLLLSMCPCIQRHTWKIFLHSSGVPLSGTTMDFTQIIQSFNNLCQPATSAHPLPQESPSGTQICPEKKASLEHTLNHLLPPVFALQHTGQHAVLQLLITSSAPPACPAPPASPGNCTQQLLLQGLRPIWTHTLTSLL